MGFKEHSYILNKLKEVSIAIVPSRWDEPFGRSSLEASSRGCALILSNTGGLRETTDYALVLNEITEKDLFNKINLLIKDTNLRKKLQKKTYENFTLTNNLASKTIDNLRIELTEKK